MLDFSSLGVGKMTKYMSGFETETDTLVQVKEFRGGSWDANLASTMQFINETLKDPASQLVDIGD